VAGILGALLATPVIATGREVLFYLYRKLLGQPPFPPETLAPSQQERSAKRATVGTAQPSVSSGTSGVIPLDGERS
jgi:hypothetical protein